LKTILLVEDNPSDIDLAKRALSKTGFINDLVIAENGQEALDYLFGTGDYFGRDTSQKPAVVIMDIKMTGVDGIEILRRIRNNPLSQYQPVVMLTSSNADRDIQRCYELNVNGYIKKPIDFNEFVEAIQCLGTFWLTLNILPPAKQPLL
jgi:two-component system, response regulator